MITKPIIKNNIWIDKLYYIFFPSALKFLLRAVKLSLFLFCFSASIKIQSNSKILIEPFSEAFSEELTIEKAKIAKAVWKIKVEKGRGTGFFISKNKIVTNSHVVQGVKDTGEITIVQEGNPRRLKVKRIVSLSIGYDLALLEVDGVVSDFLSLPEDPLKSSNVYALGYLNGQFQEIRQTGVLKADYFFSDNFDISGTSGSPVLNEAHQLVGVLYKQYTLLYQQSSYNNNIFFIGLETLKSFIKDEHFLCEGNIQECFKSLRETFEKNPQEVKRGKDSYNISEHLSKRGDYLEQKWWLEKAAKQGYVLAQYSLAVMYYNGEGVEQDLPQAIKWFEKAAEQDFAQAQYSLAVMYDQGEGVEQDLPQALKWYERAAKQGDARAQYSLAMMYDQGEGRSASYITALKWYEKAAKQGHARAQHNLAVMYYKRGGAQDLHRVLKWYKKAAKQGDARAQYSLGVMYYKGEGVEQDLPQAIKWFEKAAEQDFAQAQYSLAVMYYNGEGVKQNRHRALEWFEKAAKQGYVPAKKILEKLFKKK